MPSRSYFSFAKVFISLLPSLSNALPLAYHPSTLLLLKDDPFSIKKHEPLTEAEFYIYMTASICLVLLGGVFAGLTLGLMGQDEVYLKVIAASGTPNEKRCAKQVLELLDRGKHWLLVTLLLSNVVTNETLPVILDRFLGGGFAAVFSSTVSIVIFGEIIPQSVCVRYGLELGAFFAPYVLVLMYMMYPVAYPIATLLDYILGQDHGTLYRKSGLKTLVNLHHQMGAERLNFDEVTIISAVLDLKAKPVSEIMTPIEKVYTLPSDKILDESTVEEIFNAGYSRIPIHLPEEPHNFVGMLLVRILISYDPDDELPVSSFPLATLPETSLDTSCLNILNYFQEGKSHMVVVSETPGMDTGAKGVLTLEDVIEELIGEEIIDESDVYVDVNKNIKRTIPGPLSKRNFTSYLHKLYSSSRPSKDSSSLDVSQSKTPKNSYIRKDSVENINAINSTIAHGMKPSNLAINPLQTTNTHITIKKQPQLTSPRQNPSNLPLVSNEIDSLIKSGSKNNDYGSSEEPEVHVSEASAFVQGVHDNVNRNKESSTPLSERLDDISSAKRSFLNNTYGIPVPKATSESVDSTPVQVSDASVKSQNGGITENNIISHRGVSKTIIAEHDSVKHSSEDSLIPDHKNKEFSNGSNTDLNSKQNKSFWDWK